MWSASVPLQRPHSSALQARLAAGPGEAGPAASLSGLRNAAVLLHELDKTAAAGNRRSAWAEITVSAGSESDLELSHSMAQRVTRLCVSDFQSFY